MASTNVGIETKGNKLRLRFPRQVISTAIPRYLSTGLVATPDNQKLAQIAAWDIEADIKAERLADTYLTYVERFKTKSVVSVTPTLALITLSALWAKYCDYKRPQLAVTTYEIDYCKKWANHITKLPQQLDDAIGIRDLLVATYSIDTVKRLLTALSACCHWGTQSGLIAANPFSGMAGDLKRPKTDRPIDPFSRWERDAILGAFVTYQPSYYHFVRFMFLTGCRTGEAIGLRWQSVLPDLSSITFCESYSSKLKTAKCTKTGVIRKFPCNIDLRELLADIKPAAPEPTDLVFPSPTGLPIDNSRFTSRVWKGGTYAGNSYRGILPKLIADGFVTSYRSPYNTRHTFITMALEAGLTIPQVAKLVGNSPDILLKHYAGSSIDTIPRL